MVKVIVFKETMILIYIIFLICSIMVSAQNLVITTQGSIRGVSHEGYVSYKSIPYATIDETGGRFKRAGLAPFWLGIREAPESLCTQSSVEECLRVDVHVPAATTAPWPVLVWVPGGSGQYHPGKLVQQGIILVIVHHRLSPLGFMCLTDENVPGNAGAKDVVLALRWVRDNIVAFRGNPAKVVVAGQSFGAAIVEALMLSPMAHGLFHGAILQSGTVLSPWAFNYDAEERATILGRAISDSDEVEFTLLNTNTVDLLERSKELDLPYFPFGMCIEKAFKNEEQFLPEAPFQILSNKNFYSVPIIAGYNSDEAYIFASNIIGANVMRRLKRKDFSFLLPYELRFLKEREKAQVIRLLKDHYFSRNASLSSVLAYHRDAYFVSHIQRSVHLHASASQSPVYFYQFSHSGDIGVEPEPGVTKTGAAHSDELGYLFPENGQDLVGETGAVQQQLIKLWTNFVKYLNPTPRIGTLTPWEATGPDNSRVLNIGTSLEMTDFPHRKAAQMWDDIYDKYYYSKHRTSE